MPVVSKGEFTVSRLDDGVSSYLHVGWLMADGTFTTEYPGENLLLNSSNFTSTKNWGANDGTTISVEDGCLSVYKSTASSYRGVAQTIPVPEGAHGKRFRLSTTAKGASDNTVLTNGVIVHYLNGSGIASQQTVYGAPNLTTEFQHLKYTYATVPEDTSITKIRVIFKYDNEGTVCHVLHKNFKLAFEDSASIYTPAPTDDYLNAYPKYRGEYTDTIEADSTDPTKYTWTAYLGEQGPPTGVISQSTIPSSPYVGMLWQCTGNIAGYINPATYRWNGSAWEIYQFTAQNILAETFTGFVFRGVEFIGSKFVSEFDIPIGTETGAHAVGQTVIENGGVVTDMVEYLTDGDYDKHLEFSPNKGILMTYKGRQTSDTQEAQLTPEGLRIKTPVAEAILSVATIYSLVNPARNNTAPPDDANRKGVVVNYFRVGNLVNVAIKFELLKDTGWVALAPSPPSGYAPTSMYQASGVAGSISYRGQTCMVYCNTDGLRLIPTTGQGTGVFQLSLTWTTTDPFPYGDS